MNDSPTHRLLRGRFAVVRRDLDEAISRLTDEMLPWAPAEGMRTISGQLQEIAATEMQEHALLQQLENPDYNGVFERAKRDTVIGYQEILLSTREATFALIDGWSESELSESIPVPPKWFEALDHDAVPRAEIFRSLAGHEWYHTAQLVSYLWTRGDDPYQW